MICDRVTLPDGTAAIVCSAGPRKRCACGRVGTLLCDWKTPDKRRATCDAPICDRCATSPAPGKDLCLAHAEAFAAWRAEGSASGAGR